MLHTMIDRQPTSGLAHNYHGEDPESVREFLLSQLDEDAQRALCVEDGDVFFSICMGETFNKPSAPFHRFLVGTATSQQMTARRICAVGPRGWGKSTTITEGGPVYIACRNNFIPVDQRYRFILIVSETSAQAEARLATIKDHLETNEKIAELFPDAAGKGPVWRQSMIVTRNDICIATAGMATSIRGIRYKNRRPDLILLDDPDSLDTATSPTESAKLQERFDKDLLKCGHKKTDVLVAATLISKMCLAYKLLYTDAYAAWDGRVFKALEQFPTEMRLWDRWGEILKDRTNANRLQDAELFYLQHKVEMDIGGISNWPEEYTVKELMREYYTEGRKSFLTEKQNEIIESDLAHFSPERYKYWTSEELEQASRHHPLYFAYVDPSGGKAGTRSAFASRGPDLFSLSIIAKIGDGRYMLVDHVAAQIKQSLQFEQVALALRKWPIFRLSVETNAGQLFYYNALKDYILDKFRDPDWVKDSATRNLIVPRAVVNTVAKEQRISMLEPYLDNWTLLLPQDIAKKHRKLMDELECWPSSEFDDCLDSLSGCFFSCFRTFKLSYLMHGD